jgi:glycosyltransferase involved in cell wall biosynthesis
VSAEKASYIYNMVPRRDRSSHGADAVSGRIVYVGQIIPVKGLHLLLEAISILRREWPELHLQVVGDMNSWCVPPVREYRDELLARAAKDDLRGGVEFVGWRDDTLDLLSAAWIHCCPSLPEMAEAFGIVNVEAKSVGVPSVVFPTGALPELIQHEVDGWVCTEVSVDALIEGLKFFRPAAERNRAGNAARVSLERFSDERFASKWVGIFRG